MVTGGRAVSFIKFVVAILTMSRYLAVKLMGSLLKEEVAETLETEV